MFPRLLHAALLTIALSALPVGNAHGRTTVSISCSSLGAELELCRSGAEAWARKTGNKVKIVSTPADANERLALYQTLLAAQSPDIDVFQIDVIWPGILAGHFVDLREILPADAVDDQFDLLIANNTVDGRLIAVPWFVDAGLLYYRRDLLEKHARPVPRTWTAMVDTAQAIQRAERSGGDKTLQGFVWQGRAYEGLTCNALEWVSSFGGGTIVDQDGSVNIDNAQAALAIDTAAGWTKTISPAGVLNSAEEDARGVFQSGNAVFMRNWPYAWALVNAKDSPVRGKVGIARLPMGIGKGARHAATLGGQQLAVSRYSRSPHVAADLVRHLTSHKEQKRRSIQSSFNPARPSLYKDADVLRANPFYRDFLGVLESSVVRPSTVTGRRYNQMSSAFVRAVHRTLSGRGTAADNLAKLARDLERLSRGGRW